MNNFKELATIDWVILVATLLIIVLYGTYKTRKNKTKTRKEPSWPAIGSQGSETRNCERDVQKDLSPEVGHMPPRVQDHKD